MARDDVPVIDRNNAAELQAQSARHVEELRNLVGEMRELHRDQVEHFHQVRQQAEQDRQGQPQPGQAEADRPQTNRQPKQGNRPRSPHVETGRAGEGETE